MTYAQAADNSGLINFTQTSPSSSGGQTSTVAYGSTGPVLLTVNQQTNSDQTSTISLTNASGVTSLISSTLDGYQIDYAGNGVFTFGSPQADPDGLVNRLNINGTFGTSGLVLTDPATGVTATVPRVNGSDTTLQEGRSVASDLPNEQVVSTQANGQVDDAIIGAGAVASLSKADITLEANTAATVNGGNDTISLSVNGGDTPDLTGTGNHVTSGSGSDLVDLAGDGSGATVSGAGTVDLEASNQSLTLGNAGATVVTAANVTNESINGSSDTINEASGTTASVTGNGDTINFAGNSGISDGVTGQGAVINGDTGNDKVTLFGNWSSATLNSGGGLYLRTYHRLLGGELQAA